MSHHDHAPAWLFSFVDLAFLLLIAMTQIGVDAGGISLELGEVLVPRIHSGETLALPSGAEERWQLRVHPADETEARLRSLLRRFSFTTMENALARAPLPAEPVEAAA